MNNIDGTLLSNISLFCQSAAEYAEREGYYIGADHITNLVAAAVQAAEYEAHYCQQRQLPPWVNEEAMGAKGRDWARHEVLPSLVDEA